LNKKRAVQLQEYLQFNLEKPVDLDPGEFLACFKRKFLVVRISANASTTLDSYVCSQDYPSTHVKNPRAFIGHALDVGNRISKKSALNKPFDSFIKFAVYRDPLERFHSVYKDKILKSEKGWRQQYFRKCGINGVGLDEFIDFSERELTKPVLDQDQHIRKQSSYYTPDEVDYIVNIQDLTSFFSEVLNLPLAKQLNIIKPLQLDVTHEQAVRIRGLYKQDYKLLNNPTKIYNPALK